MAEDVKITKTTETHTKTTSTHGTPAPAGAAPVAKTLPVKTASGTSVDLIGEVTPNGAATQYWFEYGKTPDLGHVTAPKSAGNGSDTMPASASLSGLEPGATYHFRLVAENVHGKVPGAQHAFRGAHQVAPAPADKSLLTNILTIAGFVIVIVIVIWGLVHLASLSGPWFSSLFEHPAPSIQVTAPASATSGDPVSISWKYNPPAAGSYAFLYQCQKGLQFETQNPAQSATSTYLGIPCGIAYTVQSTNNSMAVLPLLSGTTSVRDTLSIIFIPSATGAQAQGTAAITINTATPAPSAPAKTAATVAPTSYAGPADLSVRVINVGVIDPSTGLFVNRAATSPSDMVAVQFDIANIGGSSSGSYYFTAQLPTAQSYPYTSPLQTSLAPGSHIVNTLRFTDVAPGGGTFSVSINTSDANGGNNYASISVPAPYYSNTNYNYNYGNSSQPYVYYPTYPSAY